MKVPSKSIQRKGGVPNGEGARIIGSPPERTLDAIEEAQRYSRGQTVQIPPQRDIRLTTFSGWKFEMIKLMCADKRLKPDSSARVGVAMVGFVNARRRFTCWPRLETIAVAAGVSVSTVKKALRVLERYGYFQLGKSGRKNLYRFHRTIGLIRTLADLDLEDIDQWS